MFKVDFSNLLQIKNQDKKYYLPCLAVTEDGEAMGKQQIRG